MKALVAVAALVLVSSAMAATPKAWQWTPDHAAKALVRNGTALFPDGGVQSATCIGVLSGAKGRYSTFKCTAKVGSGDPAVSYTWTIWAKIRKQRSGAICLGKKTMAAIPADCLTLR